jgi:hypothetical protein
MCLLRPFSVSVELLSEEADALLLFLRCSRKPERLEANVFDGTVRACELRA